MLDNKFDLWAWKIFSMELFSFKSIYTDNAVSTCKNDS